MAVIKFLEGIKFRQTAHQFLNVLMVISSALMIWKGMTLLTNSESPIVVVLSKNIAIPHSGSMEPAFYRGDLLFLTLPQAPVEVGDICVFKLRGKEIPIVHRVLRVHTRANDFKSRRLLDREFARVNDSDLPLQYILTKGDNNPVDDRGIANFGVYNPGQQWIHESDVIGRVRGYLPYVGMVTIIMNEYPKLKWALLGILMLFVFFSKD